MYPRRLFVLALTSVLVIACSKKKEPAAVRNELKTETENGALVYYLPNPTLKGEMSIEQALAQRRSQRNFLDYSLTAQQLSQLLWAAYGTTGKDKRTAPSAGARYPLEIYALIGNVKNIVPGVYKYDVQHHKIVCTINKDIKKELTEAALNQEMIHVAPCCLFYAAVYSRTVDQFGLRGSERYVCMDLGHSAQNVYLQATAMNLGTCAIGQFKDDAVKTLMNLPKEEIPLYIMPVGRFIAL